MPRRRRSLRITRSTTFFSDMLWEERLTSGQSRIKRSQVRLRPTWGLLFLTCFVRRYDLQVAKVRLRPEADLTSEKAIEA